MKVYSLSHSVYPYSPESWSYSEEHYALLSQTALVLVIQFRAILVASLILEVRGLFSRIAINPAERYRHSIAENQE